MKLRSAILILAVFSLIACNKTATETKKQAEQPSKAKVIEASNTKEVAETETAEAVEEQLYAAFEFEKSSHDFGDIKQGDVVKHTFKFTNVGDAPLVISNTRVTCGCTTPSYTKEPVAPGETGEIEVQFNSTGKSGKQNKVVTIFANTKNQQEQISISTMINVEKQIEGPYKVQ